jgi:hypothetical protein
MKRLTADAPRFECLVMKRQANLKTNSWKTRCPQYRQAIKEDSKLIGFVYDLVDQTDVLVLLIS